MNIRAAKIFRFLRKDLKKPLHGLMSSTGAESGNGLRKEAFWIWGVQDSKINKYEKEKGICREVQNIIIVRQNEKTDKQDYLRQKGAED